MSKPTIALIIPLGESPVDPGFGAGIPAFGGRPDNSLPSGGHPSQPIFHPGHPDHGLPSGGYPSQPIFHPGHPDHGLPASPGHPSQGLPNGPGHIDNSLPNIPGLPSNGLPPVPGTPVQLPSPLPAPAGDLASDVVVAVWNPNTKTWKVTSWDVDVSAGTPLPPTPAPTKS